MPSRVQRQLQRGSLRHDWQHQRVHKSCHRQPSLAHLHLLHQWCQWHIIHCTTTTHTHHLCTSLHNTTLHTPTVMNDNRRTQTQTILLNPGHPRSIPLLDPPVEWQCITRFYSTLCLVIPFDSFPFPNTASFCDSYYSMTPILTHTTKPLTLDTAL